MRTSPGSRNVIVYPAKILDLFVENKAEKAKRNRLKGAEIRNQISSMSARKLRILELEGKNESVFQGCKWHIIKETRR